MPRMRGARSRRERWLPRGTLLASLRRVPVLFSGCLEGCVHRQQPRSIFSRASEFACGAVNISRPSLIGSAHVLHILLDFCGGRQDFQRAALPKSLTTKHSHRYEITLHGFDLQGGSASYPPRVCEYGNTDTGDFYFDDTTAIDWDNSCSYDW